MRFCRTTVLLLLPAIAGLLASCTKNNDGPAGPYTLNYGDSILYLRAGGTNIFYPTEQREGNYEGFPEGIEIDDKTGAIDISKSETGLRYRITHTAPDGTVTQTKVVLSGITFTDHFYRLSQGDSVAHPVYNADLNRILPLSGSNFDDDNLANSGGCSVKTDNGRINLAETIRNGVFGFPPRNDAQQTFEIKYRINDASGKSQNKLKVLLYWYNTMADVPQYVWDILNGRTADGVFLRGGTGSGDIIARAAKPRPPCVIIIAN